MVCAKSKEPTAHHYMQDRKETGLKDPPALLPMLGFAYSFFGVMVGPQYSFDRYDRFVRGELVSGRACRWCRCKPIISILGFLPFGMKAFRPEQGVPRTVLRGQQALLWRAAVCGAVSAHHHDLHHDNLRGQQPGVSERESEWFAWCCACLTPTHNFYPCSGRSQRKSATWSSPRTFISSSSLVGALRDPIRRV